MLTVAIFPGEIAPCDQPVADCRELSTSVTLAFVSQVGFTAAPATEKGKTKTSCK